MADHGIVPLELETTTGTFFTLWAPGWTARGEEWQAFLGDDSGIFGFPSPAALLAWIRGHQDHDLADHPAWKAFMNAAASKVTPRKSGEISFIEVPNKLAGRPSFDNVKSVSTAFNVLRSLGAVCGLDKVNAWFRSYSILGNTARGADHYNGENGLAEWSSVGYTVLDNWKEMIDLADEQFVTPDVDDADVSAAEEDITAAEDAKKEADAAAAAKADAAAAAAADTGEDADADGPADPYDSTPWAAAGIDPIRITVDGTAVYTLRCYIGDREPVFLGADGQINTFTSGRSLVRWIIDAKDHDLARFSTWDDLVTLANAGELEVSVHSSNDYGFTGLREDITKGTAAVDTDQLSRAYELLADAADWADDDAVNKVLLAYPRLQDYVAFMLGSPSSGTPTAPFDEEAEGWGELEKKLTDRFTKF
ncbi:hypothetical protein [Corynebacterium terpenotabidum]|uniref:Primosomal protein n=1 Tax=Corynebacterium terpenotabidum Y-11 TaxID=1200352 RepID=S4XLG5_9CORY|nr:hypothetical protein [Corynebacterium terpenotabidum]AGP31433.1 hypothetical protein A606_08960 [Corynebacterium terpenotabidum Y-11]